MLLLSLLNPDSLLGNRGFGGWSLAVYILFFVYGFLLVGSDSVQQTIARQRWLSLILGVVFVLTLAGLMLGQGDPAFATPRYVLIFSLFGLSSWCWILAFLGFGMRRLTFNTPWLHYANEAVLPFYVLHQSVLIFLGYFVVRWPLPDGLKWLIVAPASLIIIMALYELLVRRVNALRFLFGMKPLPKTAVPRVVDRPASG